MGYYGALRGDPESLGLGPIMANRLVHRLLAARPLHDEGEPGLQKPRLPVPRGGARTPGSPPHRQKQMFLPGLRQLHWGPGTVEKLYMFLRESDGRFPSE